MAVHWNPNATKWVKKVGNTSVYYREGSCDDEDPRPTEGIAGDSKLLIKDKGVMEIFDEEDQEWTPWGGGDQ